MKALVMQRLLDKYMELFLTVMINLFRFFRIFMWSLCSGLNLFDPGGGSAVSSCVSFAVLAYPGGVLPTNGDKLEQL